MCIKLYSIGIQSGKHKVFGPLTGDSTAEAMDVEHCRVRVSSGTSAEGWPGRLGAGPGRAAQPPPGILYLSCIY